MAVRDINFFGSKIELTHESCAWWCQRFQWILLWWRIKKTQKFKGFHLTWTALVHKWGPLSSHLGKTNKHFCHVVILLMVLLSLVLGDSPSSSNLVHSIKDDLPYDENGKLASYHLFYPADNPDFPAAHAEISYGYQYWPMAGESLHQVFPGY